MKNLIILAVLVLAGKGTVEARVITQCTKYENATVENFNNCPSKVKLNVFSNAKPLTVEDLKGQVLDPGFLGSYLLTVNSDNTLCIIEGLYDLESRSLSETGVWSTVKNCKVQNNERVFNQIRSWNGVFIRAYEADSGGIDEKRIFILEKKYPIPFIEAKSIVDNATLPLWRRIDAFASVAKNLSDTDQVSIVLNWMDEPSMITSRSVYGLYKFLREKKDPRATQKLIDLLNDGLVSNKNQLLKLDIELGMTSEISTYILSIFNEREGACGQLRGTMARYAEISIELQGRLVELLNYCYNSTDLKESEFFYINEPIFTTMKKTKMRGTDIVNTVTRIIKLYKDNIPQKVNDHFKRMIVSGISLLGDLEDKTAYQVLSQNYFLSNHIYEIAIATREAKLTLDTSLMCNEIINMDINAITRGMNFIINGSISKKQHLLKILATFNKVKKSSPEIKNMISGFANEILRLGYYKSDVNIANSLLALIEP